MRGHRGRTLCAALAVVAWATSALVSAQFTDSAFDLDHPSVEYRTRRVTDHVAELNTRLASGETALAFDDGTGYLRPLLDALHVPVDSQVAVFSKTSLQSQRI